MRFRFCAFVLGTMLMATAGMCAQQPEIVHARLTVRAADGGLREVIRALEGEAEPVWVGYGIPVEGFRSGWNSDRVAYLEGSERYSGGSSGTGKDAVQDQAAVLLRIAHGAIEKVRVEGPDRQIDAGGLRVVWLTDVTAADSVRVWKGVALAGDARRLRDSAVFLVALHRSPEAVPALLALAAPGNDVELREKAAFWLASQRGREGFLAIQRFAREDGDAPFREKLTFDLTLSKEPAALEELIRMAHNDASPQVRRQAQFWMATRGGGQVAGDLRSSAANDPDQQVRQSAVFALSRLPGDQAASQLIEVAGSSKDPEVRKQAIFWLGQSNDPRALEYLTKLLTSSR